MHPPPRPFQSWSLFFILPLFPPPVPLTSEIVILESLLYIPSHPLLFSPPFHLVSSLVTPSCLSCQACKNTCASLLFVHKCTNAWMSGNCQSGEVEENCDGKNGEEGAENTWTANIQKVPNCNCIPGCVFLCCKRNKECGALDFHILASTLILKSVLPSGHERSVLSLRLYNYHKC